MQHAEKLFIHCLFSIEKASTLNLFPLFNKFVHVHVSVCVCVHAQAKQYSLVQFIIASEKLLIPVIRNSLKMQFFITMLTSSQLLVATSD